MLPTLVRFLEVLEEDINTVQERPNGTTRYGDERETRYPRAVKLSNGSTFLLTWPTDWCSIKCGHAYHRAAGWPAAWQLPAQMFYTPEDVAAFKAADMWIDGPHDGRPGDFVFFDWKSDSDRLANHVATVVAVLPAGYLVHEGNVGNPSVQYRRTLYARSADILGFGRPKFAAEDTTEEDMAATLIQADDGDIAVLVSHGPFIGWVRTGDQLNGLKFLGVVKPVEGADVNGVLRVPRALITGLVATGQSPIYPAGYGGPRTAW